MKATSLAAYSDMQPKIKTDHDKILSVMKNDESLTYNEIAWRIGWNNPVKAARRLPELLRLGKVKLKEVKRCTRANSLCSAYVLNS